MHGENANLAYDFVGRDDSIFVGLACRISYSVERLSLQEICKAKELGGCGIREKTNRLRKVAQIVILVLVHLHVRLFEARYSGLTSKKLARL